MKRMLILGIILSMLIFAFNYPFSKTIHGIVKDSAGTPLPGVTIQVKGTSISTATNANGEFSISVPDERAILVFSYTGYDSQEVKLKNNEDLAVGLKPTTQRLKRATDSMKAKE